MDNNPPLSNKDNRRGREARAPPPPYHAALHSVQRPPGKPWKKPDQPPPPKVYRVHPRGFRDLVQQLTGGPTAAQPMPRTRPLRDTAPPPPPLELSVPPPPLFTQPGVDGDDLSNGAASASQSPTAGFLQGLLSPSLYSSWYSFPLLSPAEHI